MKKIILGIVLALSIPLFTSAATFLSEKDGNVLVKGLTNSSDNIYAAGKSVSFQQVIFGDAVAAGGTVSISENVSEDVWMAGASVSLLGSVGEDARIAGSNVLINSQIGKDLLLAGGTVTVSSKTIIGGDTVIGGGIVTFDGIAQKSARIYGGEIVINGTINGDVNIVADEKLSFGPGAKIKGNLNYKARKEVEIPQGVVSGKVTFEEKLRGGKDGDMKKYVPGLFAGFAATSFLIMLIASLALLFLLPKMSHDITSFALNSTGSSLLRGFLTIIFLPILSIALLVTILGVALGLTTLAVFALLMMLAKIFTAIILGSLIAKLVKRDGLVHLSWKTVTVGALALSLLCLIPVLGWLTVAIIWLISIGAVANYILEKLWFSGKN